MSITAISQSVSDGIVLVTATSDLGAGQQIYYHWYIHGSFVDQTTDPVKAFHPDAGEQLRIDVIDSLDAAFDAVGNAPLGFPPRRTLQFVRSLAAQVDGYIVEQKRTGQATIEIGRVANRPGVWQYSFLTPPLMDLSEYRWFVSPYVDSPGPEDFGGSSVTIGPEYIVRTPDAPDFTISFDEGTDRVTFTEVAA